jgi:cyclophilin family peptidyl-prolyl cis-trans isomerase
MKGRMALIALLLTAMAFAGCTTESGSEDSAVICTNLGPITLKLFSTQAPITVANFVNLANSGYYDGVTFHRIMSDFMMQGGDPDGTGAGGEAYGGGNIPDEFDPALRHDRPGILSMANAGANTGGSQFFITFVPTPWLDDKHSIFGEVTDGMDIVEQVNAEGGTKSGEPSIEVFMHTVIPGGVASDCPTNDDLPEKEPAMIAGDVITAGTWKVTNQEDSILAYAVNTGGSAANVTFSFTGINGTSLPEGWQITIVDETGNVVGDGEQHTLMHLTVPAGTSGTYDMELHTELSTTEITVGVDLDAKRVSKIGDAVNVQYSGYCTTNGEVFDAGEFPLTLGAGRAIPGFDVGLVGLKEGEAATLVLPAQIGYGSNGGPCKDEAHAGMSFDVEILTFNE